MHKSLTPRANTFLAVLWASSCALAVSFSWHQAFPLVFISFAAGVVAGLLQGRALSAHTTQFRAASTAIEVRHILVSSWHGKVALALLWVTAIGAFAWAFNLGTNNPFIIWVAAYTSFALARELFTLPAVFRLAKPV
ncbi:MAG: hypothetical protein ACAH07_02190 [Methylophilaceae bacterium]|nr:hypothetical protein [Methyloradius sp.]